MIQFSYGSCNHNAYNGTNCLKYNVVDAIHFIYAHKNNTNSNELYLVQNVLNM